MKIAMVSTTGFTTPPEGYGGEVYVWWLTEALCKLGHEVYLFASYGSNTPSKGKLIPLRKSYGDWIQMIHTENEVVTSLYIRNELLDCDVVHDFSHNKQVAEYCYRHSKPCISTLWGNTFNRPNVTYNVVCWSQAHKYVGVEGGTGYEGTPFLANPSGKLNPTTEIVLGGVDTDYYSYNSKREPFFLWFSRAHPSKGLDIALQIARELPEIHLVVSGSFTTSDDHVMYGNQYLEQIKQLPNVEYTAMPIGSTHHEFKKNLYQNCIGLIFSVQYKESFGLIPVEAMSTGCPIISSDRGSMLEIVKNGVNGFICSDIEHYKSAIRNVLNGAINSNNCRNYALNHFSMERVATDYLKLYERAIKGEKW